nr:hypothetical protein [uncultured bacterium]
MRKRGLEKTLIMKIPPYCLYLSFFPARSTRRGEATSDELYIDGE